MQASISSHEKVEVLHEYKGGAHPGSDSARMGDTVQIMKRQPSELFSQCCVVRRQCEVIHNAGTVFHKCADSVST